MNKFLTALIMLGAMGLAFSASAQTFMQRGRTQTPAAESGKATDTMAADAQLKDDITPEELAAIENKLKARVTAAEIIEMQAPILKANKVTSQNMRPEEARRMVDSINAIEKIKARRASLSGDSAKPQKAEEIKINVYDNKAVEELLNRQVLGESADSVEKSTIENK